MYDFLDSLTLFGLLKCEGLPGTANYSNTVDTDFFLDKKKHSYVRYLLEMLNHRLYGFWGNLEEGLMARLLQNEIKDNENLFEALYADAERRKEFIHAMSGIQMGNFMMFGQGYDFSKYKMWIDIGGSAGMLSLMVAKHQAHMTCVSADLPAVEPIAKETN